MNGQQNSPVEQEYAGSPSAILGIRLLCTMLLGIPTIEFYEQVERLRCIEWVLNFFTIDVVMDLVKMHFKDEQSLVLIVMDEVNAMEIRLGQQKVKYMLDSLASFISFPKSAKQLNQIILPVVCSTSIISLCDVVRGFGRLEPSLTHLSEESIERIYKDFFKDQRQLTYIDDKGFKQMLVHYGTLPRSLELLLANVSELDDDPYNAKSALGWRAEQLSRWNIVRVV